MVSEKYVRNVLGWRWCHGNEDSLRVQHVMEDRTLWFMVDIATYRIGPRGALYRTSHTRFLGNPDSYRRQKWSHDPNGKLVWESYTTPKPFPDPRWCDKCGFLFEGGWKVDRRWEKVKAETYGYPICECATHRG